MRDAVIQIVSAGLGTLGFALLFRVRGCHLLMATLGGSLSWLVYLLVRAGTASIFFSNLVAAMAVCLWSEGMARLRKAPANIFLLPGIIPLLPGSALYYMMNGIVSGDWTQAMSQGLITAHITMGIAGGIIIGSEVMRLILGGMRRRRRWLAARRPAPKTDHQK